MSKARFLIAPLVVTTAAFLAVASARAEDAQIKAAEDAIRQELAKPTQVEFVCVPLVDGIKYLSEKHKIDIQLDQRVLDERNLKPDATITAYLRGTSLRAALRSLLRPLGLSYVVQGDVVLVTTEGEAKKAMVTKIYDVHDLVDENGCSAELIKTITSHVQPNSWNAVGALGVATVFTSGGTRALVVSNNEEAQDAVDDLLAELRALDKSGQPKK